MATFSYNCIAQSNGDSNLDSIAQKIVTNVIAADKEKTLLVTDRKIYTAGETVYFKAFVVDSIRNYLQASPQKLYVDCVDKNDSVIHQLILNNANFQTCGNFILPDSLSAGFYWIRAYTKPMLNNNINNIAVTPFYIVGKNYVPRDTIAQRTSDDNPDKPILQFYPEGGSTISGLNSTIALSAKDKSGNPLFVSGIVKNNHDSIVATFDTNRYGLAKFSYYPKWFSKYVVFIKNGNKFDSITALPPTNFYATQLAVTEHTSNYITAQVALEDSIYSKKYVTYLIAISNDSICYTGVGSGMYNTTISLNKFPAGVTTLYLFNDKGQLLSSRRIYIKKQNYHLTIQPDKENYSARNKVKLNFKITDVNDQPEVASLSLSVADKNVLDTSLNFFQTDTLQNFSPEEVDLIMLAQKQELNPLYSTATHVNSNDNDSGFTLSGIVVNAKRQPVSKCIITILSKQAIPIVETDTSTADGKFKFNLPPYADSTQFVFQLSDIKGKSLSNCRMIFSADSIIHFATPSYLKKTFPLSASLYSIRSQLAISDSAFIFEGKHWLKPVTVIGYKKKAVNYDESKRVSRNSTIITRDMIGEGANMTKVALLSNARARLLFMGSQLIAGDPLIVLDGVEIPKGELIGNPNASSQVVASNPNAIWDFLNSIPVSTIDFIEVLVGAEAAAYGMEGGHGVILINTRAGGGSPSTVEPLKSFYAKGFYTDKPFEMPDYSNPQIQNLKMQDLRKTIYWNGNIVTDKNGEASVEFFAADEPTTYVGVVTGITINGDKIYQTFTISRN